MADYFIGADWKIPDWVIKITFLVKVKTAVRLDMKSRFGVVGFSTSDAIWDLRFLTLTVIKPVTTVRTGALSVQGP